MTTTATFSGWGGFAEYCLANAANALSIPAGMSDAEAAGFVVPYKTAHIALVRRTHLRAGETLLVLGASGSAGAAAIQLGKAIGARVIAVGSGKSKLDFCVESGADHALNNKTEDIVKRVHEITSRAGANVIFDPVGGDLGTQSARCIARDGRFGLVGFASGSWAQIDPQSMVLRNYSAVGVFAGSDDHGQLEAMFSDLGHLAESGQIRTPVARIFSFMQMLEAVIIQERGDFAGKLIVEIR